MSTGMVFVHHNSQPGTSCIMKIINKQDKLLHVPVHVYTTAHGQPGLTTMSRHIIYITKLNKAEMTPGAQLVYIADNELSYS